MTVVNSKEFSANQTKYYILAVNEQVFIKRGKNTFHLMCANINDVNRNNINGTVLKERVYYEPDEDFYQSITAEEFRESAHKTVERAYKKYTNERNNTTGSSRLS